MFGDFAFNDERVSKQEKDIKRWLAEAEAAEAKGAAYDAFEAAAKKLRARKTAVFVAVTDAALFAAEGQARSVTVFKNFEGSAGDGAVYTGDPADAPALAKFVAFERIPLFAEIGPAKRTALLAPATASAPPVTATAAPCTSPKRSAERPPDSVTSALSTVTRAPAPRPSK